MGTSSPRNPNPTTAMLASGQWAKVGRKHYRHESGAEVRYDNNAWGWRVNDRPETWQTLTVAVHNVETGRYM